MKKTKNFYRAVNIKIENSLDLLLQDLMSQLHIKSKTQLIRFALWNFIAAHGLIDKANLKQVYPDIDN
jgi:hypothetical protein